MIESGRLIRPYREEAAWGGSAAVLAALLLSGRIVPIVSPGRSEWAVLVVFLSVALALVGIVGLLVVAAAAVLHGRRAAGWALLIGLGALGGFLLPLGPTMRDLDERVHRAAREDIVRRLESGGLSRSATLAGVPTEYAWAVSACGGHNLVSVHRDALSSRVMFCAPGGFRNGNWWVVYDSADRAPDAYDRGLEGFGFERVERLREHWYRVVTD